MNEAKKSLIYSCKFNAEINIFRFLHCITWIRFPHKIIALITHYIFGYFFFIIIIIFFSCCRRCLGYSIDITSLAFVQYIDCWHTGKFIPSNGSSAERFHRC